MHIFLRKLSYFIIFFFINTQLFSKDYYWIGGSGKWSEPNHWATTSGGTIWHGGVPNDNDNVIFDINSFSEENQVVTIDVSNAYCKSMIWDGAKFNPKITGVTKLFIYGSLRLINAMTFDVAGLLIFETSNGIAMLKTLNKKMNCDFIFNGSNISWSVDAVNIYQNLIFNCNLATFYFDLPVTVGKNIQFNGASNSCEFNSEVNTDENFTVNATGIVCKFKQSVNISLDFQMNMPECDFSIENSFSVGSQFIFNGGNFTSNNQTIKCYKFLSLSNSNRNFALGTSYFYTVEAWQISSQNLILQSQDAIIIVKGNKAIFNGGTNCIYNAIFFEDPLGTSTFTNQNNTFKNVYFKGNSIISGTGSITDKMFFYGNGIIQGTNTYKNITFSEGKEYTFESGKEQIITESFTADGTCKGYIYFKSSTINKAAYITKISGIVTINFSLLRDIYASGGSEFNANNSFDMGGNFGWKINPANSQNLYWVGGSGNWNDINHWSFTSGGSGGACIPSPFDNVFFDDKSFTASGQSVIVNAENIFCKSMDWTGAKFNAAFENYSFYILNNIPFYLNIYGSLTLIAEMNFAFAGFINFEAKTKDNTITLAGNKIKNNVYFKGIEGEWILQDEFALAESKNIELYNGSFVTNNQKVTCYDFSSIFRDAERKLTLGNSTIIIKHFWTIEPNQFTLDAGTSTIVMKNSEAIFTSGNKLKYYNIEFDNASGTGYINSDNDIFNYVTFFNIGRVTNTNSTFEKVLFYGEGVISGKTNYFKEAVFYKNGSITQSNTYDNLTLTKENTYTFNPEETQTINISLNAKGTCNGYIYLQSAEVKKQTIIKKISGSIDIEYTILRDMKAEGGAVFTANNSIDFGNNTGWIINLSASRNLYWVGGKGEWNDAQHWSYISGGSGGACIPAPMDNVFFDENSFDATGQYVLINSNAYCKNMDWKGAAYQPLFKAEFPAMLFIYGSMNLILKMDVDFTSDVSWEALATGNFIRTGNHFFNSNFIFNGKNAGWELKDSLMVGETIFLNKGILTTNDKYVFCSSFLSLTADLSELHLGNSLFEVISIWNTTANFKITTDKSLIRFTGSNGGNFLHFATNTCFYYNIEFKGTLGTFLCHSVAETYTKFHDIVFNKCILDARFDSINSIVCNDKSSISGYNYISKVEFKNYGEICGKNNIDLVLFDDEGYISDKNTIKKAIFYSNGKIYGENLFNTLKFSPDKTYTLESFKTQNIIDTLDIQGNNCFKLQIQSSFPGAKAYIQKENGTVAGYALRLKDIETKGKAIFYAGGESQNILNSSSGWVFLDHPGYIYGLVSDTIYYEGETAKINTLHFNGDANTTYLWNDLSTQSYYNTTKPQKLWVTAVYAKAPLCYASDTINVFFVKRKNVSCIGSSDGSIEINTDEKYPYTFLWENSSSSNTISSLSAGIYAVKITDIWGKTSSLHQIPIKQPEEITSEVKQSSPILCFDGNDGAATVTAKGGTAPYSFIWDNDGLSTDITAHQLSAKKWFHVKIIDANNCPAKLDSILLEEPVKININFETLSPISCTGKNDGSVHAIISGGIPPYQIKWDNENLSTQNSITDMVAGKKYTIQITDANNCLAENSVTLKEPDDLQLTFSIVSPVKCFGDNSGVVSVAVQGGNAPYKYVWNNQITSTTNTAAQLKANTTYQVTVTDNANCKTKTENFVLTQPNPITVQFDTKDATCRNFADGIATANANGGTAPYSFRWIVDNTSYNQQTLSILKPDIWYKVAITDANSCPETTDSVKINTISKFSFTNIHVTDALSCFGDETGIISLNTLYGNGAISYSLNQTDNHTTGTFSGLKAGKYQIVAVDAIGCEIVYETEIIQPDALKLELQVLNHSCFGSASGAINTIISGGVKDYSINWQLNNGNKYYSKPEKLLPGIYTVTATDANGCKTSEKTEIQIIECPSEIEVPNIFTPNGDNVNDLFKIKSNGIISFKGVIYNRWGTKLFEWIDINSGWDGKVNNQDASAGAYFYIIQATGIDNNRTYTLKGTFELVR